MVYQFEYIVVFDTSEESIEGTIVQNDPINWIDPWGLAGYPTVLDWIDWSRRPYTGRLNPGNPNSYHYAASQMSPSDVLAVKSFGKDIAGATASVTSKNLGFPGLAILIDVFGHILSPSEAEAPTLDDFCKK